MTKVEFTKDDLADAERVLNAMFNNATDIDGTRSALITLTVLLLQRIRRLERRVYELAGEL